MGGGDVGKIGERDVDEDLETVAKEDSEGN